MKYPRDLIGAHNTIGGAPRDIVAFCDCHEPRSLDALLLRYCTDPDLLRRATELVRTDGVLALALRGADLLSGQHAIARMLNEVHEIGAQFWRFGFCRDGDVIWTRICRYEGSEISWEDPPFAHYMDLLQRGVPFSFLRYSDGEWACALETVHNGFGYQWFTPELSEDLQISLIDHHRDPRCFMAMAPIHHFRDRNLKQWELITSFLRENDLDDIRWTSQRAFNRASEAGEMGPFFQHLRRHNTIVVGPPRLRALQKFLPRVAFVTIPAEQCHAQLAAIQKNVLAQKLPAIILVIAGVASVVLIHKLFKEIGNDSTMIDMGSLFGPYIGRPEHQSHLRMTPEIIARNVGGIL